MVGLRLDTRQGTACSDRTAMSGYCNTVRLVLSAAAAPGCRPDQLDLAVSMVALMHVGRTGIADMDVAGVVSQAPQRVEPAGKWGS